MTQPLIGITTYRSHNEYSLPINAIAEAYIKAIANAGGIPVLIPLGLSEEKLDDLVQRLDGILFTGGGDIQPERYGGQAHQRIYGVDHDRDRTEWHLVQAVVAGEQPFLGICRGFQVLNAALGGSLYEDIGDQKADAIKHDYFPDYPRSFLSHSVQVQPESRLGSILGEADLRVNSLHHQGVRQVPAVLKPTAYAPDGLVEAVELPEHIFGIAVQWHPEWLQEHEPMRALFQAFVQLAGGK